MDIQSWTWNAETIGKAGAIFFTFIELIAAWNQNKAVWRTKSGEAISIPFFLYFETLFISGFLYGQKIESSVLIFNGLGLGLIHVPLIMGLYKFKGFTRFDWALLWTIIAAAVADAVLPYKAQFYLVFSIGNGLAILAQAWEIWKIKSRGVIELKLLLVYLTSTVFWVIYGYAINDAVLKIICPMYLTLFLLILGLWIRYPRREMKEETTTAAVV